MPNPHRRQIAISSLFTILASSTFSGAVLAADTGAISKSESSAAQAAPAAGSTAAAATSAPAGAAATPSSATSTASTAAADDDSAPPEKMMFKPGQTLTTTTDTEDIVATYDVPLAMKQCAAYPDSPEAAFILAVALSRTSRVEESLKEVRHAQKLAETKGGPAYFDKMIASYEQLLVSYPDDNKVRYGLAWAYYMKAYLLGQNSRRAARWKKNMAAVAAQAAANGGTNGATAGGGTAIAPAPQAKPLISGKDIGSALSGGNVAALATAAAALSGNQNLPAGSLPHIPTALDDAEAADVPGIKHYYELAFGKLDEILKREPDDVWTIVYRAHLMAEYSGNLDEAMKTWRAVAAKHPNNPAPYFFLGEGFLKQGNLKESINHVSKAIALRALGN